jgi:hypothetical protein
MDTLTKGAVVVAVYMALPASVSFGIGLVGMFSILNNRVVQRNVEIITNVVIEHLS